MTALVDEAHRDVDGVLDLGVALVERAKFGRLDVAALVARRRLEAGLERQVLAHHERRHRLGDLVAQLRRVAEDTRRVAHRGARLDGRERHDLGDVVRAVAFGGVADHVAAVALVEVHVDVGHGATPRVQEPLEDQAVAQRVDVHDAQAVRDAAPGRGAAARADADAGLARVTDEVPDDEEVVREAHVGDDAELLFESRQHFVAEVLAVTLVRATNHEVAQ